MIIIFNKIKRIKNMKNINDKSLTIWSIFPSNSVKSWFELRRKLGKN